MFLRIISSTGVHVRLFFNAVVIWNMPHFPSPPQQRSIGFWEWRKLEEFPLRNKYASTNLFRIFFLEVLSYLSNSFGSAPGGGGKWQKFTQNASNTHVILHIRALCFLSLCRKLKCLCVDWINICVSYCGWNVCWHSLCHCNRSPLTRSINRGDRATSETLRPSDHRVRRAKRKFLWTWSNGKHLQGLAIKNTSE